MTFFHVATVLRDACFQGLHPTPRLILTILADMANDAGDCWPSQATLAERAGVSPKTVRNSLKILEEAGYVTWRQRFNTSCVYQLRLPAWRGKTETREVPAAEPMPELPDLQDHDHPASASLRVDAPEASLAPDAPVEAPSSPTEAVEAANDGDGQGEAPKPAQAHLATSMPVEENPTVKSVPDPERILLSEAARLIQSLLPSVAWELGDTATIKRVAYQLERLRAIGLSARKIRELTADWPDFVHNPPGFVLSRLQELESEHAGSRMDARQAQRRADQVERPRLTDRELAEERDRQRRRREWILAEQERQIVAREQAEKHARLQAEAAEAAAKAAAGELGVPKLDEDPEAAAKIRALALSYQAGALAPQPAPESPLPWGDQEPPF